MTTASPIAKVSVGRSGCGAAHASYITRLSALDPEGRDRARSDPEEHAERPSLLSHDQTEKAEPSVTATLRDNLDHRSLDAEKEHGGGGQRDADPVWTWNAPDFLTGDTHGTRRELGSSTVQEELTLKEKTENLRLYFGSLEDYERRKGGRTHYRIILSFDVPATNQQIRDLANNFLKQTFPKAIAFGAIHRDTDHPHAHLYLNSRQTDGRRIQLKNNEFKTIDEKWSKIYTDFAGDKSAHVEYLRKKEETKQWKIAAAEAYRKGEPIPPKPERDNDRRERLAEQRLAAQRSDARDRGKQIELPQPAEPVIRPASEKQTSRLLAKTEVAREQLAHLIRTDAPEAEIKSAARIAYDFGVALDRTLATRKELGRERTPQVVYTTEEWKQLKEYRSSAEVPVKDDRAAGRLQAAWVVAGAQLTDAQERREAFQASRHLWRFDIEGWDRKLSLRGIEDAIKTKKADQFKVYNFLRPTKRDEIGRQIEYLEDVKKDIQKQLAAKELSLDKNLGDAEMRYQMAAQQINETAKARAESGKEMPAPVHQGDELVLIDTIANRNKDARLLQYVYSHIREKVLSSPTPQALSRVKGRAIMARLDMLREADRFHDALKYAEFRQLPLKDGRGADYTKSLREVAPKSALEMIIRHFTDSQERKDELKNIADTSRWQLERAERKSNKATDFSVVMDKILNEHCRAAKVSEKDIPPMLNAQEIAELREYADKMYPFSRIRQEFTDAARQGERGLREREATESARQAELARGELAARFREQSPSRDRSSRDRSDSYTRGR